MKLGQTTFALALLLSLGALIGGCANIEQAASSKADSWSKTPLFATKNNDVTALLSYSQRIRVLSAESLATEYALATQALAKQRSDSNRLKLALLLALPNAPFRDDSRAVALAEETLNNKASDSAELKSLAQYIAAVAGEQKRQEDRFQQLSQKLKEEEKRSEALQQKLDALKSIEKDLINREQTKPMRVK